MKHSFRILLIFYISFFSFVINSKALEETYEFDYTGDYQEFIVPVNGKYKLEVWGASGGGKHQLPSYELGYAGRGGYSTGALELKAGTKLYIYVGGEGTTCNNPYCSVSGGFNGGGSGWKKSSGYDDPATSGGGATDIRLVNGQWNDGTSLLSRMIVAGGGGGGGMDGNREYDGSERGGDGGGLTGIVGSTKTGLGGSQTSGWGFGYGFAANAHSNSYLDNTYGGQGAGGGWYGGYHARNGYGWEGAGGGSGFVWTKDTVSSTPSGYSVGKSYYLNDAKTIAGNSDVPTFDGTSTMLGNLGDGHAKITILEYEPIKIENLETNRIDSGTYEVVIPEDNYEVNITANFPNILWSVGLGKVTLDANTTHEIIIMDSEGKIKIYNINVLTAKAYLDNVQVSGVDLQFFPKVYEYELNVPNNVTTFNPNITTSDGITYELSDNNLKVGENIIKITASKPGLESSIYTFIVTREYAKTATPITKDFEYTGNVEEFIAPYTGEYKLEVWGAQGGGCHLISGRELGYGGKGGYSTGKIYLTEGEKIYVYVGGAGTYCGTSGCISQGGYNGGGSGYKVGSTTDDLAASGGGATDIRLVSGLWNDETSLLSRVIVAGGGGGGGMDGNREYDGIERGGDGGGLEGVVYDSETGLGGTQTSGWAFGSGFSNSASNVHYSSTIYGGPGGGGGWYGGNYARQGGWQGAGGGSGFVWTKDTSSSVPNNYNVSSKYYLKDAKTIAGNTDVPTYDGESTMLGNSLNGHAKITYYDPSTIDNIIAINTSVGSLSPEFSPNETEYDLYLDMDETELTIDVITRLNEALITGEGTYTVSAGNTTIPITFTNVNGEVTIYNINVTRVASSSTDIKGFKINGVLSPLFKEGVYTYDIELPTEITKINLELLKKYPSQIISTDTIYDFTESELSKTVFVSSEGDLGNQPYTFNFIRKKSTILKRLNIKGGILQEEFDPYTTEYTLDMSESGRELDIDAEAWFSEAVITKVEPRYVGPDDKLVTITVELEDLTPTVYKLNINRVAEVTEDIEEGYEYTGSYQTFTAPFTGNYKLETWGAQGGGYHQNSELGYGGKGGYSSGIIHLNKGETIYIYVGGEGTYCTRRCTSAGGWNGGGNGYKVTNTSIDPAASGGGATDIRLVSGSWDDNASLMSRVIVAGGGGGGGMDGYTNGDERGGDGGGLEGVVYDSETGLGGTQTSGWAFGSGFSNSASNVHYSSTIYGGPGGGGGWYGGNYARQGGWQGAGGGSGFVYTKSTAKNTPSGYSVNATYYLSEAETIAGNLSMPTHDGKNLMTGNAGNGYAKITAKSGIVGDTFLDSITLNDGAIPLDFEPWTLEYDVYVDKDTPIVNIKATPKDSEANIIGIGDYSFKPGESVHNIVVTTKDGNSKVYKLNITKEPSDDATPKNIIIKNPQSYMCGASVTFCKYTFKDTENNYTITYPFETTELTFKTELKSDYQNVQYFKVLDDSETEIPDGKITLENGSNKIKVVITSESGIENAYNYTLIKDESGNNVLKTLEILNPIVSIDFDSYIYEYNFSVPSNTTKLELNAVALNPDAKVTIEGNENFVPGMNKVTIKVTAPNGNSRTYILNVFQELSSNAFLSSLEIKDNSNNEITISPEFNKLFTEYTAIASSTTSSVTISATAEEGTVSGTGTFTLKSGKNTFEVVVTSANGDKNTYTITIMKSKNSNSDLLNIEVEGYTINPTFDNATKEYHLTIPKDVDSLKVIVTPKESTTTYTIRGNTSLTEKSNTIVITSIAEDKTYQVYQIIVNKETSDNNYLSGIEVIGGTLNEEFKREKLDYTIDVAGSVNSLNIKGILEDSSATIVGNGTHALIKGTNTINLIVTSESGLVKTYTITVNKSLDGDTSLLNVLNNRGSEVIKNDDPTKNYDYLINVQYEVNTIEITGIASSKTSIVSGNGNYNLIPGDTNDITLRVTAEDNTYHDYIVKVVRDRSDNDDLDFIFVEEGGLSPAFSETTIYYEVLVPFNTNIIHLEAIPEDIYATVDVTDSTNTSKNKFEIDISTLNAEDSKDINIVVTADNGNIKIYSVHVTKQKETSENLSLESLETNRGEIIPLGGANPGFNPDILNYELEVENSISDITVTAKAFSDNVTVEGTGTKSLKVGKNAISVFVKGENGIQKDYQIVVTRKKSSDATLASLVVKSHVLNPNFSSTTTAYSFLTSKTSLEFTLIKPTEEEATYEVLGNNNFKTGENIVTIRVTAPDGSTTKDYVLTVTKEGSKNNNLASLEVVGYTLKPTFHKGVTLYTTEVANDVNSVVINATAEDTNASITGTGLKTIKTGENYFEIVVTSETNTKKVYTVLITKEASDNNYLASLSVDAGPFNETFVKTDHNYTITVPYTTDTITVKGKLEDNTASTNSFTTYSLVEGENIIPIVVTSESGMVRTYNITVTKESIISAYLKDLNITGHELDSEFNKEVFEYFITVNSDTESIIINAIPEDVKANVEISGNTDLQTGMNEVKINVTASDNSTTLEYIVYVNKEMSTNNYLSSLIPSLGNLSPAFDPKVTDYTVTVPRDTESIDISATTEDKSATITSGVGTHNLNLGNNLINIKVKSSIGITRTYKVNVIREMSKNNYLEKLKVVNLDNTININPTFDKLTNKYTAVASSDLNFIQIIASAEDEFATLTGNGIKELKTGLNTFDIIVTAEDGTINTYTLEITKEVSSNNYLSSLIPSVGKLKPEFNKEITEYSLDLTYEESNLEFIATLESNLATITGTEMKVVPEGVSTREIIVTAEDGSVKTYTITVNKETAAEARLDSLMIKDYPFEFDPDTFTYNIKVSNSKRKLLANEITAIAKDEFAIVNLMGDLDLIDGATNNYIIEVIARDGYTTEEYRLNITRDSEEHTIRSDVYNIVRDDSDEDYVIRIEPNQELETFMSNFLNDRSTLKLYDKDNNEVTSINAVGTGAKVKLEIDNIIYDEVRVIVSGDTNGDGKVNVSDSMQVNNTVLKKIVLSGYQFKAGDINHDGKINVSDSMLVNNYVLKKIATLLI